MLNLDDRLIREVAAKIKPNALSVLLAICIHLDKRNRAFPSVERLQKLTGLGRDAVYNAIEVLITEKLVIRDRKSGAGGKFGSTYYFIDTDLIRVYVPVKDLPLTENQEMDSPHPEKPDTVKPNTVQPDTENPTLSINSNISINHSEVLRENEGESEPVIEDPDLQKIPTSNTAISGVGVKTSKVTKRKQELKQQILFRETEFVVLTDGFDRFCKALISRNEVYQLADLDYYYRTVWNWSDQNDNRKKDWIATAANFILGDERKGGFKKAKTNLQNDSSSKSFNTITERDIERAERLASRFGWKPGG